jgi:hypothetical protein
MVADWIDLGDRLGIGSSAVRGALVRIRVLEADMQ